MKANIVAALALAVFASVVSAQNSRDITGIPPTLVKPPIAYLCPNVPVGTIEAFAAISGRIDAGNLMITVNGKCFRQKPRNLGFSIFPNSSPRGQPPLGIAGSVALESWTSASATFRTSVQNIAQLNTTIPMPKFSFGLSIGTRTFSATLTEVQFSALQSGGTINDPPLR